MMFLEKRALDFSSALVYNLLRKVLGIEISDCPQCESIFEIASKLWSVGMLFLFVMVIIYVG